MQKQASSSPLLVICRLLVLGESKLLSIRYFHLRLCILGWGGFQLSNLKRWALSAAIHHLKKCFKLNVRPTFFFFCEIEQTFIETLRTGGASAYTEAIKCSRAHLGPCALNAYPVCALLC